MKFKSLASGSKGNLYVVESGDEQIILEMGLSIKKIKEKLNYDFSKVKGCLLTHEHKDHSKAIEDIAKLGLDIYSSPGTFKKMEVEGHRYKSVANLEQFNIGSFTVLAFETEHDSEEPLGFLIQDKTGDKLLFATDTAFIRYKFKGLTKIAIECNFSERILEENTEYGIISQHLANRIRRSHFSLEKLLEFFKANDLTKIEEIYLLHLSDSNSSLKLFEEEIREVYSGKLFITKEGEGYV